MITTRSDRQTDRLLFKKRSRSRPGLWRAELGWRLYFDYWIHGKKVERDWVGKKYSEILPRNYLIEMSDKTLRVAISEQLKFYYSVDKRAPKPDKFRKKLRDS